MPFLHLDYKPLLLKGFLSVLLFFIGICCNAQQAVMGYLRDSITHYPIHNGTITNWNTNQKQLTTEKGFFRIQARPGDLIYIQAPSYHYDTLRAHVLLNDTISIYLNPTGD